MSKVYCLYHSNCNDGLMAAAILRDAYLYDLVKPIFIPVNYKEPPPELEADSLIYIVDFCYPPNELTALAKDKKKVVVIDHHDSAIRKVQEFGLDKFPTNIEFFFSHDNSLSGAGLTWKYFHEDSNPPHVVQCVSDYDTWQLKLEHTITIYHALATFPRTPAGFQLSLTASFSDLVNLGTPGKIASDNQMDWVIKNTKRELLFSVQTGKFHPVTASDGDDLSVISVLNTPHFMVSLTLHNLMLREPFPEYQKAKFVASYFDTSERRVFRLNSQGYPVNKIAESYGGGGHVTAASFSVPRDHWLAKF